MVKLFLLLIISVQGIFSLNSPKNYEKNENVILYVNKVGPYYNPHETYPYYSLPLCKPNDIKSRQLSLSDVLDGDRLVSSMYKISFMQNVDKAILCNLNLMKTDIERLIHYIEELYYFEFVIDENIPFRGFIGNLEESKILPHYHKALFYTHHNIVIKYNGQNIVYASVYTTQSNPLDLMMYRKNDSLNIVFSYSIHWVFSNIPASRRNEYIAKNHFFPRVLEIHWISISNSLVLVLLLITFISFIFGKVLHRDFARYNKQTKGNEMSENDEIEERGWKIIHNDVFRPPTSCRVLFCGIIGCGAQMLSIAVGLVVMVLLNVFDVHNHGVINMAALVLYSLTSWVGGFVSTRLYTVLENTQSSSLYWSPSSTTATAGWVRVVNVVSSLFTVPLVVVWLLCNTVSLAYGTTHSMPLLTMAQLGMAWLLVGYPLTIAGGMIGHRSEARVDTVGCRARNIPREIPAVPWYKSRFVSVIFGGFMPFSSVCIELFYIFSTVWGREHYNLYGILFIVLMILIIVTVCVSVCLVYFQLIGEDYRWWWSAMQLGLSSSGFVFFYCLFHFFFRSHMRGLLQTVEYFGYSLLVCYAFFLGISAVAFFSSLVFIRFIYRNIKLD